MIKRLIEIVEKLGEQHLVVLGDFLLDEFLLGEISRVSREAPVLILRYQESQLRPGGAANTVANVASLGPTVVPIGIVGDDDPGRELVSLWPENVQRNNIISLEGHATTRKTRVLAGSFHSYRQQVVRIDYENKVRLTPELESSLLKRLEEQLCLAQAMIISDYSLGITSPAIREGSLSIAREKGLPVVVDSRDNTPEFRGATTVTPNISEVETALRTRIGTSVERLESVCRPLLADWKLDALLVTRGKLGLSILTSNNARHIPPFGNDEVVDVTGAGDTVVATYASALAAGADHFEAAQIANYAGGLVVMKKGTATVTPPELIHAIAGDGVREV